MTTITRVETYPELKEADTVYIKKNADGTLGFLVTGDSASAVAEFSTDQLIISGDNAGKTVSNLEQHGAKVKDETFTLYPNGSSGNLNFTNGGYQTFTPTAHTTISFSGMESGRLSMMTLSAKGCGSYIMTFPSSLKWIKPDGTLTSNFSDLGITLKTGSGVDYLIFFTDDGVNIIGKVLR